MKIKKYKFMSLIIVCMLVFQIPIKAHANIYGGRWYKDIKMYIQSTSDLVVGPFLIAQDSWNKALVGINANIRIIRVYSASEANLIVKDQAFLGMPAGISTLYPSKTSSSYTSGTIVMNLNKLSTLSASYRTTAATHELGHILGLDDTTLNASVMKDVLNNATFPTAYDKSELDRIY